MSDTPQDQTVTKGTFFIGAFLLIEAVIGMTTTNTAMWASSVFALTVFTALGVSMKRRDGD